MRRREFIAGVGVCAVVGARGAWGQQASLPRIGFLNSGASTTPSVSGFREGLEQAGFIDGRTVLIEYRFAQGRYEELPSLISELLARQVVLLVATGGVHTALAAKSASASIPVLFANGSDPLQFGLVSSLNRPGGNMTGVSFFSATLEAKRLGLLSELAPNARNFGILINPTNANADTQLKDVEEGTRILGRPSYIVKARDEREILAAFDTLAQYQADALLVAADPYFFGQRGTIVALAERNKLPSIYEWRQYAQVGGLASYGSNLLDAYRMTGTYAARILNGEKPADLPVVQTTKFEFVINLKTARALGLEVSPTLSARADEIIE
jgi:putative ABC transport system substrate-binding protein